MKKIVKIMENLVIIALYCVPAFIKLSRSTTKFKWLVQSLTAKRNDHVDDA